MAATQFLLINSNGLRMRFRSYAHAPLRMQHKLDPPEIQEYNILEMNYRHIIDANLFRCLDHKSRKRKVTEKMFCPIVNFSYFACLWISIQSTYMHVHTHIHWQMEDGRAKFVIPQNVKNEVSKINEIINVSIDTRCAKYVGKTNSTYMTLIPVSH